MSKQIRTRICPTCRGARCIEHPPTIVRNGRRVGHSNTIVIDCERCRGRGELPK